MGSDTANSFTPCFGAWSRTSTTLKSGRVCLTSRAGDYKRAVGCFARDLHRHCLARHRRSLWCRLRCSPRRREEKAFDRIFTVTPSVWVMAVRMALYGVFFMWLCSWLVPVYSL